MTNEELKDIEIKISPFREQMLAASNGGSRPFGYGEIEAWVAKHFVILLDEVKRLQSESHQVCGHGVDNTLNCVKCD